MAKSDLDFYQVLGVTRHAGDDEIKKAFRKLARDTHPDKNPNDPTAKERFQNVQHAYDTLKDTLERSKYDNDNPNHGYGGAAGASRGTPGTRTAKRYASTTTPSSQSHTPGWASGRTPWTDGYAERAAGATRSRASRGAGFYEYTEAPEHAQTKRTPRNQYSTYTSRTYEDAHSPKSRDSAYARTSQTTPAGHQPRPKSTAGQHSSTSARYATGSGGTSTPSNPDGFDLSSYIREKRAKELKQQEEERKRAERESSGSGSDRRKHSTAERERERAREDSWKAENESRTKYSPQGDAYGYDHTPGSFPADEDPEELMKEADRQMKDGQRKSTRHSASYPSEKHKPSPRPTFERTASAGASNYYPSSKPDFNVYEATPDDEGDDDKPRFTSMPRKTDYSKQPRADYFTSNQQWPSSGFGFGDPSAGPKKTTFDNVNVHHATPPQSPGGRKMKDATPPRRTRSMGASAAKKAAEAEPPKFTFSTVDPFTFQEPPTDTDSTPRRPATTANYDFNFSGGFFGQGASPRFGSGPFTTRNSPEPQKKADDVNEPPFDRPRSQPSVASPKVEMPLRGAPPPQPKKQTPKPVKKELWENLLNTTSAYEYQASEGSNAARKKRSVPGLKKKKPERRSSADDKPRNQVNSDTDDDDEIKGTERMEGPYYRSTSAAPFSTASSSFPQPQAPQNSTATNLGPEPMDTTPDFTNSPKPQSQPQPQVHIPDVFANLSSLKPDGAATASPFINGFKPTPTAGIDLSNLRAVPPLAPNPTEAGLGGFGDLKNNLPFPSRAADQPPINHTPSNASSNAMPKVRMGPPPAPAGGLSSFMDQIPPTPHDEDGPLDIPSPPRAIKVPSIVNLKAYNETYEALGKYFADWQDYEKKVSAFRAQLDMQHTIPLEKNASGQFISPRADIIEAYLKRLTERDALLEQSVRKAKKEHVKMLREWMKCREHVIHMREGEDGVMGSQGRPGEEGYRGAAPVGYKR